MGFFRYICKSRSQYSSVHNGCVAISQMQLMIMAKLLILSLITKFFIISLCWNMKQDEYLIFVKIILLKSDNCALTLRKRLFCAAKPTLLPCKTAAFGTQNNRFYNALMMRRLHDSYACEKYLHLYCLLFAQKITLVRSRNVGRRHFTSF